MSAAAPYYADDLITLYLGDCREVTEWLAADVLVTDPPYGRGWQQDDVNPATWVSNGHAGIAGDEDTRVRDAALAAWGKRLAISFGHLNSDPPTRTVQVLVYEKAPGAGQLGFRAGFRRDIEAIYLIGAWQSSPMGAGRSSIIKTAARSQLGRAGVPGRYGHPHAKPVDVMETLIVACPPGVIADPFAGSGSTLVAARNLGRCAIGVEIDERYAEQAARRLSQGSLDFGVAG